MRNNVEEWESGQILISWVMQYQWGTLGNPNQNVLAEVPKSSKKSNEKPKNLKKSQEEPKNLFPFAPIRTETNSGAGQFTGYSLSDQHIFSPINPKYERLISFRFTKI